MEEQNEFTLYSFETTWLNMFQNTFSDHYERMFFKIRAKLQWLMTCMLMPHVAISGQGDVMTTNTKVYAMGCALIMYGSFSLTCCGALCIYIYMSRVHGITGPGDGV